MSPDRLDSNQMHERTDPRLAYKPGPGEIPTAPGVYRFSDSTGRALYIGKAKNLRSRLSSYFGTLSSLNNRTQTMLRLATAVDWTVVASDTEALVLEHTWIREMDPPFNVQFRDDKSYPYLAITLADDAPRLIITRNRKIRGARYFGPFPKLWAVKELMELLQQAFPIRTCNDAAYRRALTTGVPCLASQIGKCHGPCSLSVDPGAHRRAVEQLIDFLEGHDRSYVHELRRAMHNASEAQQYERAARLRDQLEAIEHVLERNAVVLADGLSADIFGLAADDLSVAVHQFIVRGGRIRGERSWIVDADDSLTPEVLMMSMLQDAYLDGPRQEQRTRAQSKLGARAEIPKAILVSHLPTEVEPLEEVLSTARGARVLVSVPVRGEKAELVRRAVSNAGEQLQRHRMKRAADVVARTDALSELQRALNLPEPPLTIECIDISHLSGTNIVGALVTFVDGLPRKDQYRRYSIPASSDDTDSIAQVVQRRFTPRNDSTDEQSPRRIPQLLIVDGGEPQVRAADRVLRALGVEVPLCGIAKRLEEVWQPGEPFPTLLPRSSEALFLLQRIRDEAHRFAISHQRSRRSQSIDSALSEVPGLGPKRVQALLRTFKSVKRIREASEADLAKVPGITASLAQRIQAHLKAPM